MSRVRLIHWNPAEAAERIERLRAAGYEVAYGGLDGAATLRVLTREIPAAVVIDLGRVPSHGRDLGLFLRRRKGTRHVPIIFVGGDPEKVARIREMLPDAVYTSWSRIRSSLKRAIARPLDNPIVPASVLAGYSGTPLPGKLGIKAGSTVALVGAPSGLEARLGSLPENVTVRRQMRGRFDRIVWFPASSKELTRRVARMGEGLKEGGGLWVAWPKKASGVATDLTQTVVRRIGLAAGLVDYKICAIDATWSGLLFARRKKG